MSGTAIMEDKEGRMLGDLKPLVPYLKRYRRGLLLGRRVGGAVERHLDPASAGAAHRGR